MCGHFFHNSGGMLVIGANTLIYLNQSSPSVGIALNSLAEPHSAYQLRDPPSSLAISMDCSRSCFISPEQVRVRTEGERGGGANDIL